MIHVRRFSDENFDENLEAWINGFGVPVDIIIHQLPGSFRSQHDLLVFATEQLFSVGSPTIILPSGADLRVQLFEAEGGGGTILDYTTGADEDIALKFIRVTSSVPIEFRMYVNDIELERVHMVPGELWHFPQDDIFMRQTRGILGFPNGVVPPITRLQFTVDDGPCTMRVWWERGPAQFS